ncbi:Ntn hydrolase family protein [Novosphingobium clariflavum]|uniref:Proteasome-type protease n=1 Tax=Novosphingobium clariflavum TaxID=2029884 RepID=A0ABV6S6S1_9SPHN|nr:hypothetical protein [Novosphingobium clariflavum]
MTICIGVKVHDCLVLAADSATSLVGQDSAGNPAIVNVYAHGNKVFNLVKGLPVAAMTCGMGNIGSASISSIAKELRRELSETPEKGGLDKNSYTIEDIAKRAKAILYDRHYKDLEFPPNGDHSLEFYVGGYSSGSRSAELWKVLIFNGACHEPEEQMPDTDHFVTWSGQPEALSRLLLGFSPAVGDALLKAGVEESKLPALMELIKGHTASPLVEPAMPTGDAIALADFLVDVTKQYVHFRHGADTVGGDTDIATVTRYEGFKWIRRKHFYPRSLNMETDHV